MRATAILVVLFLGCGSVESTSDPNVRGETGVGGAVAAADGGAGAGGSVVTAAGGRTGAGGALAGAGGATGRGGALAGAGGMTGAGGTPGAVGQFCTDLGFPVTRFTSCARQTSPGVFAFGTKDGHACVTCQGPPATTECWASSARELCVASCTECVFQ